MNRILLEPSELGSSLPAEDRRTVHVLGVLKKKVGDEIEVGISTEDAFGPAPDSQGRATIVSVDDSGLLLDYRPEAEAPGLAPLMIILGFPRPIQAARLLRELASLGVAEIILTGTELGEKSYLDSNFWKLEEYKKAIREGAEQAGNPRLTKVKRTWTLRRALEETAIHPNLGVSRIYLHPGAGFFPLGSAALSSPVILAIGNERGWTVKEIAELEKAGFVGYSLGGRILKTETAALAATALVLARLGLM